MGRKRIWTDEQLDLIRKYAGSLKDKELASKLQTLYPDRKISIQSVRKQRQKLGVLKAAGRGVCEVVGPDIPPTPKPVVPEDDNG